MLLLYILFPFPRWDLAAGNALRQLIYDPITERKILPTPPVPPSTSTTPPTSPQKSSPAKKSKARTAPTAAVVPVLPPGRWLQFIGTTASFLTSGLIHELIFFYLTGHSSRGRWLAFFLVQVPAMTVERYVLGTLRRWEMMPPQLVLILWAVGFQCVATAWLLWRPIEQEGVIKQVINNVDTAYAAGAAVFRPVAAMVAGWVETSRAVPVAAGWLRGASSQLAPLFHKWTA